MVSTYGRGYDGPDPSEQWKKDFERIYAAGGVYVPLFHPAFIGKDTRLLGTLREFIDYTQRYDIWMTTLRDLAIWHRNKEKLHITIKNPKGTISWLEIENNGNKIEGLTIRVHGKIKAFGQNISVDSITQGDNANTKITFKILDDGKTRIILLRK